jgi:RNA 3'-terminal phosphate cyclase
MAPKTKFRDDNVKADPKRVPRIDGSTGEGGGQLLRMAVCLAAITEENYLIRKIRFNRQGGTGLKRQHLSAVNWLAAVSGAEVEGNSVKSQRLDFLPGRVCFPLLVLGDMSCLRAATKPS